MAILQQNTFTQTDGTGLNGIAMDVGGGTITEEGPNLWRVTTNRARPDGTGGKFRFPDLATNNYTIRGTIRLFATTNAPLLLFNARVIALADTNRWSAMFDVANGIRIRKTVGGVNTVKQTQAFAWTVGQDYVVEFVVNGNDKAVWVDGVKIVEDLGDTDVSSGTNIHTTYSMSAAGTGTTGWHVDTLEVDDAFPSSGSSNAPRSMRYHLSSINR